LYRKRKRRSAEVELEKRTRNGKRTGNRKRKVSKASAREVLYGGLDIIRGNGPKISPRKPNSPPDVSKPFTFLYAPQK
jgi:hypothetical protein